MFTWHYINTHVVDTQTNFAECQHNFYIEVTAHIFSVRSASCVYSTELVNLYFE